MTELSELLMTLKGEERVEFYIDDVNMPCVRYVDIRNNRVVAARMQMDRVALEKSRGDLYAATLAVLLNQGRNYTPPER